MAYERHGMSGSPEYVAWYHMKYRCHQIADGGYRFYGARGISVCDEWRRSFESFYKDVGKRPSPDHTLERIDNNGNYETGNVVWATRKQQARNKSSNRLVEYMGESKPLAEWAERTGLNYHTLCSRLNSGWSFAEAITKPANSRRLKR